jgi:putative spermidine/putrescine transport system ATP-binding protein
MDEPLGALDKKLRDEMQLEIKQLHSELAITVLYVTHDQDEALVMSDRICLMNQGGIEQIGTADELYFRPRSLFAAQFLGDSNVLPVRVETSAAEPILTGPQGRRLLAKVDQPLQEGTVANVMVRPENVRVLASGEEADNSVEAAVTDVIMLGGISRTIARLASGEVVSSKSLTSAGRSPIARGAPIRLGWAAKDTVLLTRAAIRTKP